MKNNYEPLYLYENVEKSAKKFPTTSIYFDEKLGAFPTLSLETTYQEVHEAIVYKANQLRGMGIRKGEKVIMYKSSTFDTYLLAVAVSYLGAIPAMISYHLSKETMDILSLRLDLPFIIYDDETEQRCKQMEQ